MLSVVLTRLNDPMPMLTPPLKWMCVLFCFSKSVVTFAKAWQSLVGETTYHDRVHFSPLFLMFGYDITSPTKAPNPPSVKLLTWKSDNCFGFSSLLWWSWLHSHPGTWEMLSAAELQHSTALRASLLLTRIKRHVLGEKKVWITKEMWKQPFCNLQ